MKVLLIIFCGLLLNSCHSKKQITSVAQVGNTNLSFEEFKKIVQTEVQSNKNLNQKHLKFLAQKTVDKFIYKTLIKKWADKNNVFVHPNEISNETSKIKNNYHNNDYFLAELKSQNLTLDEWTSNLKFTLLEKKALSVIYSKISQPSDQELRNLYIKNKKVLLQVDSIKIRQIITTNENSANKAHAALRNSYSFLKTYEKYSDTFNDHKQPETIWIFNKNSEIFGHLYDLKKGELSNIFKSDFGYHIAQLLDRKKKKELSFKEAKPKLNEMFKQSHKQPELIKWLTSQLKNSRVLINNKLINSVQFKQRVNSAK